MKAKHLNQILLAVVMSTGCGDVGGGGDGGIDSIEQVTPGGPYYCPNEAGEVDDPGSGPMLGDITASAVAGTPDDEMFVCSCAPRLIHCSRQNVSVVAHYGQCRSMGDECPLAERNVGELHTSLTAEALSVSDRSSTPG